jgi:3-dehydrosphinganine reductase
VRAAAERAGVPDRLFHCAGFATAQFIDQVGDDDVAGLVRTNVSGPIHVARAFAPAMAKRGTGAIVLTASDLGYVGLFGWSVYSATKHAVVGFASSLRNELKPFGVSVQALCPPATQTPGFVKENETKPASVRKAEEAGGVMTAEAVARAAWTRCGRGGLHIIPNRTSRLLFAMSRLSTDLAHSFVRAPGPGRAR